MVGMAGAVADLAAGSPAKGAAGVVDRSAEELQAREASSAANWEVA
jgi:hypothetical protein